MNKSRYYTMIPHLVWNKSAWKTYVEINMLLVLLLFYYGFSLEKKCRSSFSFLFCKNFLYVDKVILFLHSTECFIAYCH